MAQSIRWRVSAAVVVAVSVVMILGVLGAANIGSGQSHLRDFTAASTPKVKDLCSVPEFDAAGLYPLSTKVAYLENYSNGNLSVCGAGSDHTVAVPPTGFSDGGYGTIAGTKVSGQLDLILISWELAGGYYCLGASVSGCASTVGFSLPSGFCSAQSIGTCHPNGLILAKSLGFTYVDSGNAEMVTCKKDASACKVDAATIDLSGLLPVGLVQNGSTLYVSDNSCTGWILSGTVSSLSPVKSIGDSLEGIAIHAGNLYVADTGGCTDAKAHIVDATTGASLPTPFTKSDVYVGLDSDLQFDSYNTGGVYSV